MCKIILELFRMTLKVYVLKCEGDYFYIGVSDDVIQSFTEHRAGLGGQWTKIHTPVSVDAIIDNAESYDESLMLKEYMYKYGVDRVRGGPYENVLLYAEQAEYLRREMLVFTLTKIGQSGGTVEAENIPDTDMCDELANAFGDFGLNKIGCKRCGGEGHMASGCYASHDVNHNEIMD